MTDKKRRIRAWMNMEAISFLVKPTGLNQFSEEVKLGEHNLDFLVEVASRMRHIEMTTEQAAVALKGYYQLNIWPVNPFIKSLRFEKVVDSGKNILRVFAIIQVAITPAKTAKSTESKRSSAVEEYRANLTMQDLVGRDY